MLACNIVAKTDPFTCLFFGLHSTVFQRREGDKSDFLPESPKRHLGPLIEAPFLG